MIEDIIKDIKSKNFKPIYFLHGEEAYYIDLIADLLEDKVLDPAAKSFNQTILYGKDADTNAVLNAAKRFPMMSEHQLIVIKEAQDLDIFSGRPSKEKESKMELMLSYFNNPLKSTVLVFCHKYGKVDKRLKLVKAIDKHGVQLESAKIYENKVPAWANEYLQKKGFKLNAKAAAVIGEYLGNDLGKIANELDKLMINIAKGTEIGMNEIEANIGISKEFNVFELQTALATKDILKSNRIINYFAANPKANPLVKTMAGLNNYFTKIFAYHFIKDKSASNVASVLKVPPFFVKDYEVAAKNYSMAKMMDVIGVLREYDLKSKGVDSNNTEDGDLMKEMVYKILH